MKEYSEVTLEKKNKTSIKNGFLYIERGEKMETNKNTVNLGQHRIIRI